MSAADPQAPVATFPEELATREGWLEPFEWYGRMRAEAPVRYDERREVWDVFRYEDTKAILADDSTFSSDPSRAPQFDAPEDEQSPIMDTVLFSDPPEHRRLRSVVDELFRPNAVTDLAPRIEEITTDLLDEALSGGEMDIVDDLAYPMPVIVIAEMLGVPADDRGQFKEWSDALVARPKARTEEAIREFQERQERVLKELSEYFTGMIERRRADPHDDLITAILQAETNGQRLTEREVLGFCMLLLVAGNITTTNLITNAARCFGERPGTMDELRSGELDTEPTIEEVLRYRSPVQALFRVTTTDTRVGDHEISEGEGIVTWLGSANRDSEQFPDPDRFVPDRRPNQHIGFGHGTHYCLGAPLARLEAKIALDELLGRTDEIEIHDEDLAPVRSSFIYGVESLSISVH